jgi:NodT family efflux transporter outer membrane factor (OMF) lipoprotein
MKKITHIVPPLALAMALSGCMSLAPKYERPAAPVAPAYPPAASPDGAGAAGGAVATEAPSAIAWQTFFADARLKQLIGMALANNRDLRVAIANIEIARAQYGVRRADRLPTVNAALSENRSTASNQDITTTYSGGIGISAFELDLFGRVRNLSDAALAQFLATDEARKSTQTSLVASVANAYLGVLADDELLELTRRTLATREQSLKLIQLKFENGVVSGLDRQLALSLVEGARSVLASTQRQRAQDLNLLTLLVGQPIPETLAAGATLATTELPELPAGLPSDLLGVRPDIRSAEQQLIAANANIGAARAAFFPRIALTASTGSVSNELSQLFKNGTYGWSFAPQALMPIFDYGRNSANLAGAKASRDVALAQYEKSIQTAFREVADALAGQATYTEQLRGLRGVAAAEGERFRLSDLRYRNGAASYLDLLDAQRSLFVAQQAALQANLQRLQNQVTLYRVLGGGWSAAAR